MAGLFQRLVHRETSYPDVIDRGRGHQRGSRYAVMASLIARRSLSPTGFAARKPTPPPGAGPAPGETMIVASFGRYPVETSHDHEAGQIWSLPCRPREKWALPSLSTSASSTLSSR